MATQHTTAQIAIIARQLRELIGVGTMQTMQQIAPIVAGIAGIDAASDHAQLIKVGLFLERHMVGRVIDGHRLRSWRADRNERRFRIVVATADELNATAAGLRERVREILHTQRELAVELERVLLDLDYASDREPLTDAAPQKPRKFSRIVRPTVAVPTADLDREIPPDWQ